MKIFVNHFNKETFEKKLSFIKNIDFSLFIDYVPQNNDELSTINIIVLQEPNEYFGYDDWVISNNIFNVILTIKKLIYKSVLKYLFVKG